MVIDAISGSRNRFETYFRGGLGEFLNSRIVRLSLSREIDISTCILRYTALPFNKFPIFQIFTILKLKKINKTLPVGSIGRGIFIDSCILKKWNLRLRCESWTSQNVCLFSWINRWPSSQHFCTHGIWSQTDFERQALAIHFDVVSSSCWVWSAPSGLLTSEFKVLSMQ